MLLVRQGKQHPVGETTQLSSTLQRLHPSTQHTNSGRQVKAPGLYCVLLAGKASGIHPVEETTQLFH